MGPVACVQTQLPSCRSAHARAPWPWRRWQAVRACGPEEPNSVLSLLRGLLRPKYRKHVGFTPEKKYDPVD